MRSMNPPSEKKLQFELKTNGPALREKGEAEEKEQQPFGDSEFNLTRPFVSNGKNSMRKIQPTRSFGPPFRLQGEELEVEIERSTCWPGTDPANADVWSPKAGQLVPKEGAWVMITRRLPPMEARMDEKVRVARFFFARHFSDADQEGFRPSGMYTVQLCTEWGDVTLMPYEYSVIEPEKIIAMWQGVELTFHPWKIELARFNSIVFYARSRGIGIADAMVMALGTIKGEVGWFEPTPELAEEAEAMEERVHRWKPRRKSSRGLKIIIDSNQNRQEETA
jgi:hypothetical protein